MRKLSEHKFGEDDQSGRFTVTIIEEMQEDYGMFVWPCGIVLAEYVWQQRTRFSGITVVEVLENMQAICNLNELSCKVVGITWGEWHRQLFELRPQVILGADVLYESNAFDDLFATIAFLLRNTPGSVFIATYDNRSGHHLIEYLMVKWDLKCVKMLDAYSFMPASKSSSISGNIELVEIKIEVTVS
ncbi:unnamed protein product [Victoria cruziana]